MAKVKITYITERTVEVVNTLVIDYKDLPTKFEEGEYSTIEEFVDWVESNYASEVDRNIDENSVDEKAYKISIEYDTKESCCEHIYESGCECCREECSHSERKNA